MDQHTLDHIAPVNNVSVFQSENIIIARVWMSHSLNINVTLHFIRFIRELVCNVFPCSSSSSSSITHGKILLASTVMWPYLWKETNAKTTIIAKKRKLRLKQYVFSPWANTRPEYLVSVLGDGSFPHTVESRRVQNVMIHILL